MAKGSKFSKIIDETSILMGCDPQVLVTINEKSDGSLTFDIAPTDASASLADIDGFFLSLSDDSTAETINVYPGVNTLGLTDFEAGANDQTTLANGAMVTEEYDLKLQFGLEDDSTQGDIQSASFVMFTNDGTPLSLQDIDLSHMATVVNSDTDQGMVLTPDNTETDVDDDTTQDPNDDLDTCSFLIEGDVNVEVMLTRLENGEIEVSIDVQGGDDEQATGMTGDIRALFFDVQDQELLSGLSVSGGDVTDSMFVSGSVDNLGNGANVSGGGRSGYDAGVEIGNAGLGHDDDIQDTVFTLSHPEGLYLSDFSGSNFALRLTSVGPEGSEEREDSLKLEGVCPGGETPPVDEDCGDQYAIEDVMNLFLPPTLENEELPVIDEEEENFEFLNNF